MDFGISLKNISQLCILFEKLSAVTGCHFIWHTFSPNLLYQVPGISLFHKARYCDKIKNHSIDHRCRCTEEHWNNSVRKSLEERRPFRHTCYAGVTDIVVPIFEGETYCGDILIASFRAEHASPLGIFEEAYQELPKLSPERMENLPELILELLKILPPSLPDSPNGQLCPAAPANCDPRVHQALAYIRQNFSAKIDYAKLSRLVGLSAARLRHLFRDTMGVSMSEYLQRMRMSYARNLVELTELPMNFIAEKCGIFDQNRMSFLFRKYYDISPTACRKKLTAKRNQNKSDILH